MLQVVSEQRLDRSYRPIVEWANIKYQATPDLSLRFGRIALPMFLAADYRKIGYAYPVGAHAGRSVRRHPLQQQRRRRRHLSLESPAA